MSEKLLLSIVSKIYPMLRPLIKNAVNDPNSLIDELMMRILDAAFLED